MKTDMKKKNVVEREEISPMQKNYKKAQILQQKRDADASVTALLDKYIMSEAEYGPEHYRTQMLLTFLDLVVPLKELSELILDMQEAMGTLSETIELIDDTMLFINDLMTVSSENRYTFMRRIRERRKIKKFIKNHSARMKSIMNVTSGLTGISTEMRKQLERISMKMRKNTLKQKKKMDKKREKSKPIPGDNKTAGYYINSTAEKLIKDRKKQFNIVDKDTTQDTKDDASDNSGDISDVDDIIKGR